MVERPDIERYEWEVKRQRKKKMFTIGDYSGVILEEDEWQHWALYIRHLEARIAELEAKGAG